MVRNILYSILTKGFVALLNFFTLVISAKYFGVQTRGEISLFLLNLAIIQAFAEIYTGYSLVHFIPRSNIRSVFITGSALILVVVSVAFSGLTYFATGVRDYFWLQFLTALLVLLNTFFCVILLAKQKIHLFNGLSFLQPLLLVAGLSIVIFVFRQFVFLSYLQPLFFSFLIATCVSGYLVLREIFAAGSTNKTNHALILQKGLYYQATLLLLLFINRFSFYLFTGSATVGRFSAACTLAEGSLLFANAMAPVLLSYTSNALKDNHKQPDVLKLCAFSVLFTALSLIALCLLPDRFYLRLLGSGFYGIRSIMIFYAPTVLLWSASIPMANYFNGAGQQPLLLKLYAAAAIISMALNLMLVTGFGITGALIAAIVSHLFICITLWITFLRYRQRHVLA